MAPPNPLCPLSANICSGCPPGGLQCWRGGRAWTEAEWQASLAPVGKRPTIFRHQNNTSTLVSYRIAVGMAYHDWRAAAGANSKSMYAEFARSYFEMRGQRLERSHREFVKRCALQAKQGFVLRPKGAPLHARDHFLTDDKRRRRRRGRQGRKCRAGFLRDALWDWFVDIRSAVKCRLPAKIVLGQAQRMADQISRDMARTGEFVLMPKLDRHWLRRWQRDYGVLGLSLAPPLNSGFGPPGRNTRRGVSAREGTRHTGHTTDTARSTHLAQVSLRKPNKRYKCSWTKLADRVPMAMKSVYFARALILELFGHDPEILGLDQTPIYMNESGNRKEGTLEIRGAQK